MLLYTVQHLTDAGQHAVVDSFEAMSDADAVRVAQALFTQRSTDHLQLWRGNRLVHGRDSNLRPAAKS